MEERICVNNPHSSHTLNDNIKKVINVLQEKVSVVCQEIFMLGLGIFETEVELPRAHRQ